MTGDGAESERESANLKTKWRINRRLVPLKMFYFFFYGGKLKLCCALKCEYRYWLRAGIEGSETTPYFAGSHIQIMNFISCYCTSSYSIHTMQQKIDI